MTGFDVAQMEMAHKHSSRHRDHVERSKMCGCFYCKQTFPPSEINRWVDDEQTALCPKCGIDSVIGDADIAGVTRPDFLKSMHAYWFERTATSVTVH